MLSLNLALLSLVLANIADVITTNRVLGKGGVEMNPVVRWLMNSFGDKWGYAKMAGIIAIGAYLYVNGFVLLLWALSGVFWIVAIHNYRVGKD